MQSKRLIHSLSDTDRDTLRSAAGRVSLHATVGSAIGLSLGVLLAYRLRANRSAMFKAFRAAEKPTHVRFAGGREEPIPDLTPLVKPTTLGDVATYAFFAGGGLFFGGELGLASGTWSANRLVMRDADSRGRIDRAFKKFRADVLRSEAAGLEKSMQDVDAGSSILSTK